MAKLLELFKHEDAKYIAKCGEYFQFQDIPDKEAEVLDESRIKSALWIAENLTSNLSQSTITKCIKLKVNSWKVDEVDSIIKC